MFLMSAIQLTYIVCAIVIVLFAVAFIGIAALFFNAKKLIYINRLEDPSVQTDVDKKYVKLVKKQKNGEEVLDTYQRELKSNKRCSHIWSVILGILYVGLIGLTVYGAMSRVNGNQLFIGDQAAVIIETSSMQEAYSGNTYLKDNDLLDEKNRISQFSLITLNKVESEDDLELMKVYAFKMESSEKGRMITIVHRLISIGTDKDGNKRFTFRGDSNVSTMIGETALTFDSIVGEWTGYKNATLGYFVTYLQSPIGIITLVVAFLLLIIYSIIYSKMTEKYNIRFYQLLTQKYCFAKALENEKSVYISDKSTDIFASHALSTLPVSKPVKKRFPYVDVMLPASLSKMVSASLSNLKFVHKESKYLYPFEYQSGFFANGMHHYQGSMRKGLYLFLYNELPNNSERLSYHEKYPLKIHLVDEARKYFIIHEVPNGTDYVEYVGDPTEVHDFFVRFYDSKSYDNKSVTRHIFICVDQKMRRL